MQPGMRSLEGTEEERALAEGRAATPTALIILSDEAGVRVSPILFADDREMPATSTIVRPPFKKLHDAVQGVYALWEEEKTAMQAHSTAVSTIALASLERTQATVQNLALEVSATQVATAILRMRVKKWKTKYEEEAALRKQAEHMEKCWRVAYERLQAKLTKQKVVESANH